MFWSSNHVYWAPCNQIKVDFSYPTIKWHNEDLHSVQWVHHLLHNFSSRFLPFGFYCIVKEKDIFPYAKTNITHVQYTLIYGSSSSVFFCSSIQCLTGCKSIKLKCQFIGGIYVLRVWNMNRSFLYVLIVFSFLPFFSGHPFCFLPWGKFNSNRR